MQNERSYCGERKFCGQKEDDSKRERIHTEEGGEPETMKYARN
jgi:hypothetical protein